MQKVQSICSSGIKAVPLPAIGVSSYEKVYHYPCGFCRYREQRGCDAVMQRNAHYHDPKSVFHER